MPGFLGDKQTNLVHHLANMKQDCKIIDVKLNDKQYFDPDTLENAVRLSQKYFGYSKDSSALKPTIGKRKTTRRL